MSKPFWYTFYIGIAAGVFLGLVLKVHFLDFDTAIITDSIGNAIRIFDIKPPYTLYFTIIAALSIIGAVLITLYHTGKTLFDSGEYGIYGLGFGFFGGLFIAVGLFGILSIVGLALLIIGIIISFRIERDPPGTPEKRK